MGSSAVRNLYLKDALCAGNYRAIQLLIAAGENPARIGDDGSTVVNTQFRTGFNNLGLTVSLILFLIQCHGKYSANTLDCKGK
jgi:hypothetical protein